MRSEGNPPERRRLRRPAPIAILAAACALAATVVAGALAGFASAAATSATPGAAKAATPGGELLPDLRPLGPIDLAVQPESPRGEFGKPSGPAIPAGASAKHKPAKRALLRYTSEIANFGEGPLEIAPTNKHPNCDGHEGRDEIVKQVIYADTNGDSVFGRGDDKPSRQVPAGCVAYHPSHHHFHFQDYASVTLRRGSRDGPVVVSQEKVSFCLLDTDHVGAVLPGSPRRRVYQDCGAHQPMGMSVGWSDTYGSFLPGQALPVKALKNGLYCLLLVADPDDRLDETDESDNTAEAGLMLKRRSVERTPRGCDGA